MPEKEMGAEPEHIRIAKIVGENEHGLTLFVPKNMDGEFTVEDGDRFLTLLFVRQDNGDMVAWLPWSNND